MKYSKLLALALSFPFLVVFVFFDVVKLPLVVLVFFPFIGLMNLIDVLNGKKSMFCEMLLEITFLGVSCWAIMLDLKLPRWMGGI